MKRFFARGLVALGVVSAPASMPPKPQGPPHPGTRDPRLQSLRNFFQKCSCPALKNAQAFLDAADVNSLDWRLLPSISVVESGGGREAPNNNLFGWDSGRAEFPSAVAAIHSVARRLSQSRLYRDKSVDEILTAYNPRPDYPRKVKSLMRRIAFSE